MVSKNNSQRCSSCIPFVSPACLLRNTFISDRTNPCLHLVIQICREKDFQISRGRCALAAKVKRPKNYRRPKHKKNFRAAVSATEMRKQLIPTYNSAKDPFCQSYYQSKANKKILAKQRRLEQMEARRLQRQRDKRTPKWRRKNR